MKPKEGRGSYITCVDTLPTCTLIIWFVIIFVIRAFFVWPWNESARTKQKQQTNGNRSIWLVCQRTDTNARGFWLFKRTLGWKNVMPEDLSRNQSIFALTSYCNTIGQSNNGFSILGISLAGKQRVHVLILFIHWLIKEITITYRNHFSWSYENRSNKSYYRKYMVPFSGDFQRKTITSPHCHNYLPLLSIVLLSKG